MIAVILAMMLSFNDSEKPLADYFIANHVGIGVLDRESDRNTISVAATGFGMCCWAISAQRGYLSHQEALERINKAFDQTIASNPERNRGWFYHFTDTKGLPVMGGEVSSIDTVLFYEGAKKAAKLLDDADLLKKINDQIAKVDVKWMQKDGLFSHGLHWVNDEAVFLPTQWDHYSEGVLIYRLFDIPYTPTETHPNLPLFVYYYPLCFYDEPEMVRLLMEAVAYQKKEYGHWGKTACDGPHGYACNEHNVISPLSIWAVEFYVPEASEVLAKLPVLPQSPSYHLTSGYVSKDRIGIDVGSCLILREKLRK